MSKQYNERFTDADLKKMVALLLVLKIGMEHSMIREKVGSPK